MSSRTVVTVHVRSYLFDTLQHSSNHSQGQFQPASTPLHHHLLIWPTPSAPSCCPLYSNSPLFFWLSGTACRLLSHQRPFDIYHLGSYRNSFAPPFIYRTAATLALSGMLPPPVTPVPTPPLFSTLKTFLLWHVSVRHLQEERSSDRFPRRFPVFSALTPISISAATSEPAPAPLGHQSSANASIGLMPLVLPRLPLLLQQGFHRLTPCHLLPPWLASSPPYPTAQTAGGSQDSAPQAHTYTLFLNSQATNRRRVCGSGDTDDTISFPSILEDTVVLLSASPNLSRLLDADSGQHCTLLDTGQRLHLHNSSTTRAQQRTAAQHHRRCRQPRDGKFSQLQPLGQQQQQQRCHQLVSSTSDSTQAHRAPESAPQDHNHPLSLNSRGDDIAHDSSSKAHSEAASLGKLSMRKTNTPSVRSSEPENGTNAATNGSSFVHLLVHFECISLRPDVVKEACFRLGLLGLGEWQDAYSLQATEAYVPFHRVVLGILCVCSQTSGWTITHFLTRLGNAFFCLPRPEPQY